MIEIIVLLGIAGLVVLCWPSGRDSRPSLTAALTASQPVKPAGSVQSFLESMTALSHVRSRLVVTEKLDDAAKAAIETITHSLVEASDK